ncbi:MAG: hypothetical protein NTX23_07560 [Candidatus Bipolaricaulota bacterium]|nr:hypothetical protein [Candidatus Bipolaricaulota bacterium]
MNKTMLWVVLGVVAVAGISAFVFLELGHPRVAGAPAAAAAVAAPATAATVATAAVPAAPSAPATSVPGAAAGSADAQSMATSEPVSAPAAATLSSTPTVDELIQNAAAYEGQPVALRGTILTQCTAGCEFALDDGTGALSVQLEGKGKDRLIPLNKVGKKIEVHGTFHASPRPQVLVEDPNGWQFVK